MCVIIEKLSAQLSDGSFDNINSQLFRRHELKLYDSTKSS